MTNKTLIGIIGVLVLATIAVGFFIFRGSYSAEVSQTECTRDEPAECNPVQITTTSLPAGAINTAYQTTQLQATGGSSSTYSWSWVASNGSSLPAGLNFSAGGLLGGTPTQEGTFTVVISAADPNYAPNSDTRQFNIIISGSGSGSGGGTGGGTEGGSSGSGGSGGTGSGSGGGTTGGTGGGSTSTGGNTPSSGSSGGSESNSTEQSSNESATGGIAGVLKASSTSTRSGELLCVFLMLPLLLLEVIILILLWDTRRRVMRLEEDNNKGDNDKDDASSPTPPAEPITPPPPVEPQPPISATNIASVEPTIMPTTETPNTLVPEELGETFANPTLPPTTPPTA